MKVNRINLNFELRLEPHFSRSFSGHYFHPNMRDKINLQSFHECLHNETKFRRNQHSHLFVKNEQNHVETTKMQVYERPQFYFKMEFDS